MKLIRNFLLISILAVCSAQAVADGHDKDANISRTDAAKIARDKIGGKLLDIRRQGRGEKAGYRVKMLHQGRVQVFRIDAITGQVED